MKEINKEEINKRVNFLSREYGEKTKSLVDSILDDDNKFKKWLNQKPSKEFIENLKSKSHYQVECPKCKISNRKWLEKGENPYFYPIHRLKDNYSKKIKIGKQVLTQYFSYECNLCKKIFE